MSKIGVGIIGTGSIADSSHAPAVHAVSDTELVAVLSRDELCGRDFMKKHFSSGAVYTSIDQFVTDTAINLVIICSPDVLHYEQAKACLEAGKHVLVEKPMTTDVDQATELEELAKQNDLVLQTGFHLRHHAGHAKLKQQIDAGTIGAIKHIRAIWAFPMADDSNWRAKDTMTNWWSLSAVGSHCIDLARWISGDMDDWKQFSPVTNADTWRGPHDETAMLSAQLASGPTVEVTSSVLFGPYTRLEVFGDKGRAVCAGTFNRNGDGRVTINDDELAYDSESPFKRQLQHVATAIASRVNDSNGRTGLRSIQDLSKFTSDS